MLGLSVSVKEQRRAESRYLIRIDVFESEYIEELCGSQPYYQLQDLSHSAKEAEGPKLIKLAYSRQLIRNLRPDRFKSCCCMAQGWQVFWKNQVVLMRCSSVSTPLLNGLFLFFVLLMKDQRLPPTFERRAKSVFRNTVDKGLSCQVPYGSRPTCHRIGR